MNVDESLVALRDGPVFALMDKSYVQEVKRAKLLEMLQLAKVPPTAEAVAGRGDVRVLTFADERSVVIRKSLRGGLLGKFLHSTYFRPPWQALSLVRPCCEIQTLSHLIQRGVRVPRPVAAIVKPFAGLWYQSYVITEKIEGVQNLLLLVQAALERGEPAVLEGLLEQVRAAGREAQKCLVLGVQHADLHLGNVLVDDAGMSFLIDFDKAKSGKTMAGREEAETELLERWKRSTDKHLSSEPELRAAFLSEFKEGLTESWE